MNIITNRCLGGYIYRDILHEPYKNPFIWTGIHSDSFNYLFKNYRNINFKNVVLGFNENKFHTPYLLIEDKCKVNYDHVIFKEAANIPEIIGNNIYIADTRKYTLDKYHERLKRMTEEPIFLYLDLDFTKNYKISAIAKEIKQRLGILTVDKDFEKNEFTDVRYIVHQDWKTVSWWDYLQEHHTQDIMDLINIQRA